MLSTRNKYNNGVVMTMFTKLAYSAAVISFVMMVVHKSVAAQGGVTCERDARWTQLIRAVQRNDGETVEKLLDTGVDPNTPAQEVSKKCVLESRRRTESAALDLDRAILAPGEMYALAATLTAISTHIKLAMGYSSDSAEEGASKADNRGDTRQTILGLQKELAGMVKPILRNQRVVVETNFEHKLQMIPHALREISSSIEELWARWRTNDDVSERFLRPIFNSILEMEEDVALAVGPLMPFHEGLRQIEKSRIKVGEALAVLSSKGTENSRVPHAIEFLMTVDDMLDMLSVQILDAIVPGLSRVYNLWPPELLDALYRFPKYYLRNRVSVTMDNGSISVLRFYDGDPSRLRSGVPLGTEGLYSPIVTHVMAIVRPPDDSRHMLEVLERTSTRLSITVDKLENLIEALETRADVAAPAPPQNPLEVILAENETFWRRVLTEGEMALHVAAGKGLALMVERLVDRGANMEGRMSSGLTPLHVAALAGHVGTVRTLIKLGARIDNSLPRVDGLKGFGAVHLAILGRSQPALRALIELGADFNIRGGRYHVTPLDLAVASEQCVIQALLEAKGAERSFTLSAKKTWWTEC